jgi:DNA repair protein RadC
MKIAEVALKYRTHVPPVKCPKFTARMTLLSFYALFGIIRTIQLREEFIVILLNNAKRCLGWSKVSSGGSTATIVDPAHVMQTALLGNSQSLILAHNHPSGLN